MAKERPIPNSIPGSPTCGEWESLLTDALDGLLNPADEARFLEHKAACPSCAGLDEQARTGREWLEFLSPEPEPPDGLFEKILAATGPGMRPGRAENGIPVVAGAEPAFAPHPGLRARMGLAAQPRLRMTAAMAFFSIALTLNLAGLGLRNLHLAQLRPQWVRSYVERQVSMASVPVVRYYDHLRFIYEVKEQVRALRSQNEEQGGLEERKPQPQALPGESLRNRLKRPGNGGKMRVAGPSQPIPAVAEPGIDAEGKLLETFLAKPAGAMRPDGSRLQRLERSTPWIASFITA